MRHHQNSGPTAIDFASEQIDNLKRERRINVPRWLIRNDELGIVHIGPLQGRHAAVRRQSSLGRHFAYPAGSTSSICKGLVF